MQMTTYMTRNLTHLEGVAEYVQVGDMDEVKEDLLNRRFKYRGIMDYAILRGPFMYEIHNYGFAFDAY